MKTVGASSLLQVLCITLTLLSMPQQIYADPVVGWLGPWSPTLNPVMTNINFGAKASAVRSFGGFGAPQDLSISKGDAVLAKPGIARPFLLSGSPEPWNNMSSTRLMGMLFAPDTFSSAIPAATETVVAPSTQFDRASITPGFERPKITATAYAAGTHPAMGFLHTAASIGAGLTPFQFRSTRADLAWRTGDLAYVGIDAVRVPESSTLFLLGLGLIALAQIPLRQLAKKTSSTHLETNSKQLSEQKETEKDSSLAA